MATRGESGEAVLGCLGTLYSLGAPGGLTDGQLLESFVSRPQEVAEWAFAALVQRHGGMVLGVCRRALGDRHSAEDAFQATFLVLARRACSIRRSESVAGWLHRVARRIAGRASHAARRRRGSEGPLIGEVEGMREPSDALERGDLRDAIDQEIDRLGDDLRQAVVLCDLEGLTYEQAAERLRWPVGTVKSRLSRARGRLRDRLIRRGVAPALAAGGAAWGVEASAGVSPALAGVAVRSALAWTIRAGAVSPAVAGLAREEAWSMSVAKFKLGAACLGIVGVSTLLAGLSLARGPGPVAADPARPAAGAEDSPSKSVPAAGAIRLAASGRVVDGRGRPVPGARVFIREWAVRRTSGMSAAQERELERTGKLPDILAETRTDPEGRFRFEGVVAPSFPSAEDNQYLGKTWFPWDIVALADGHGAAWARLSPRNQTTPLTLALPAESKIQGRVTEPGGRPIAGAAVRVYEIAQPSAPLRGDSETSEERLNLNWSSMPIEATTDSDGRFVIPHLPPEVRVSVLAMANGHQREFFYAGTTDRRMPDLEDTTYQSGRAVTKSVPIRTGPIDVTMKPTDHRLLGRLVSEASGDPVAGATVLNGWERLGETDADGRFTIEDLAAGTIELHAKGKGDDSAPLAVAVEIPEGEKVIERTFRLPRGVAVSGRVVDGAGGGVAGAKLRYEYAAGAEGLPSLFGLEATTDAEGRFHLAVPAGKGTIVLVGVPAGYPALERRAIGSPPEEGLAEAVEGRSGDVVGGLTFVLDRGNGAAFRVVGPGGRPVEGAEIRRYALSTRDVGPPVRTDAEGRAVVAGLRPEATYTIDVVHPGLKIGRRVELDPEEGRETGRPIEVALAELGSVEGRVLDAEGKPFPGPVLWLRSNVKTPEQLGVPLESANKVRDDGSFRFDGLVPGGTYYVDVAVEGYAGSYSSEVVIEPGAARRLEPFRLPVTDRDLKGLVVDPRGKPVAGATVGLDHSSRGNLNASGRWFMNTDAEGRFHLTNLPRGPLNFMVYRSPEEPERSITNLVRVEVPAGQPELRVELPDARRRLQGIED